MTHLPTMPPPPPDQPGPPQAYQHPSGRAGWATAIGIISIVLASLNFICLPVLVVATLLGPRWQKTAGLPVEWYGPFQLVLAGIGAALAAVLLAAGISLLGRRRSGRTLHLAWAALSVLMCLVNNAVAFTTMSPAKLPPRLAASTILSVIIMIPVALAYPVFLLIWFNRAKIKQQVSRW